MKVAAAILALLFSGLIAVAGAASLFFPGRYLPDLGPGLSLAVIVIGILLLIIISWGYFKLSVGVGKVKITVESQISPKDMTGFDDIEDD